jgi:hypothetical protein
MLNRSVGWFALFGLVLSAIFTISAGGVILQWDPNPEPNVAGYRVYYGLASRSYTSSNDVSAPLTGVTISNLERESKYFFAVTAFDTDGLESDYSDEVWIVIANDAPVALNSSIQTLQNQPAAAVLTGTDSNGDALEFSIVTSPSHGTLVGASPEFTYVPAPGFYGLDTFQFVASDGRTSSAPATVSILVTPGINEPPTLDALASISINEDSGDTIVALSGIAPSSLARLETITVTAFSDNPRLIPNPTVTYLRSQSTGSLSIRPAPNEWGTANIIVTVNDGGNAISRLFMVTVNPVNDLPFFDPIANISLDEDSGVTFVTVTGIGSGAGNEVQTLSLSAISGNTNIMPHPTVAYTSPQGTGTLALQPLPNQWGSVRFRVLLSDGIAQVSRFFTVTVRSVEDPPALDPIADLVMSNSTPVKIPLTGISSGASNEAQTLTVTAISDNPEVVPNPSVIYSSPGGWGALTLEPVADAGIANIRVTVSDGASAFERSFKVIVKSLNHPPIVNAGSDQTVALSAQAILSGTAIDDGLPRSPGTLTVLWTQVGGAGRANFSAPDSLNGGVTFLEAGDYVLRLTVSDGAVSASDDVRISVTNDLNAPRISDFSALALDARTIVVGLLTDRPATSAVMFSASTGAEMTNTENTLSTNHFIVLTNLEPDASYAIRVLCTDVNGMNSSTNDVAVRTPPVELISVNAAAATTVYPMIFSSDAVANYFLCSMNDEMGGAIFSISVPVSCGYRMWCRIRAPTPNIGSFYLSIDDGSEVIVDVATPDTPTTWRWVRVRDLTDSTGGMIPRVWWLEPETHQFVFRGRAAWTLLSDVLLTNDPDWVPQ